ncbi:MAG: hypothetical protein ACKOU7_10095 [Ferruginibacter sp.]
MQFITACSQDLSGNWQGRFRTDQRLNGASRTFFMNMVLVQHGKKIEGRFGNAPLDFPDKLQVVYEISGIIGKRDTIPSRLMRGNILFSRLEYEWADYFLSLDNIQYFKNDTMEVLYGDWLANGLIPIRSDGFAGSFWVSKLHLPDTLKKSLIADTNSVNTPPLTIRKEPDALLIPAAMAKRKNTEAGKITLDTKNISLSIFDNGVTDGDSVSIFFNGKLLMSHQLVSEKPIVLNLELDEKLIKNEIVLFAENLGSISPNTALIVVKSGDKRYELFSNADLEKNAVLVIEYRRHE